METALDLPPALRIDTTALTRPVSKQEVRAFVRAHPGEFGWTGRWIARRLWDAVVVLVVAVLAMPFIGIGLFFILLAALAGFASEVTPAMVAGLLLTPLALLLTVWGVWLLVEGVRPHLASRRRPRRALRLSRFAADNDLRYVPRWDEPPHSGDPFTAGSTRSAVDVIAAPDGSLEIGNLAISGGLSLRRSLRRFGYVRIRLPGTMPHLVLEPCVSRWARSRRPPWQFRATGAVLLPGGDFRLHVAPGYESAARGLLTPELLEVLRTSAPGMSVEIVDDSLYLYSTGVFDMTSPSTYHRLIPVAASVWYPAADYSFHWTDGSTVDGRLAWRGRRLTARFSWGRWILAAYAACVLIRLVVVLVQG